MVLSCAFTTALAIASASPIAAHAAVGAGTAALAIASASPIAAHAAVGADMEESLDFVALMQVVSTPHNYLLWHEGKEFEAPIESFQDLEQVNGLQEMRFHNVGVLSPGATSKAAGMMLDMLIQSESEPSGPSRSSKNMRQGVPDALSLSTEMGRAFTWTLVRSGTFEKVVIPDFTIGLEIVEEDQGRPFCEDTLTVWDVHSYALQTGTHNALIEVPDGIVLCSRAPSSIPNSSASGFPSGGKKRVATMLNFRDRAGFTISLRSGAQAWQALRFFGPPKQIEQTFLMKVVAPMAERIRGAAKTSPALADLTALEDPHAMNIEGEGFNIRRSGKQVFLRIPRDVAAEEAASLHVLAVVEEQGQACEGRLYVTEIRVSGSWLGDFRSLSFSTGTERLPSTGLLGLKVGASGNMSVEEFSRKVPSAIAELSSLQALKPNAVNQPVTTTMQAKVHLGPATMKINWVDTKEKMGLSTSLTFMVVGLRNVQGRVGGLLGEDSHNLVATPPEECAVVSRVETLLFQANSTR